MVEKKHACTIPKYRRLINLIDYLICISLVCFIVTVILRNVSHKKEGNVLLIYLIIFDWSCRENHTHVASKITCSL